MSVNPLTDDTPVPSRRRPRREESLTYRIRVDLDGIKPPIWRRIEVSSHLTLDRLHHLLQTAMGWTDSHLHDFVSGAIATDRLAEHYLSQASIDEDLEGIDETTVRLDELLVEPGDRLFYVYDFGDNWTHTLRLESVSGGEPVLATVLAGARSCPPEDCGGTWGYEELLTVLQDTADPDPEGLREWTGPDFDPESFSVAAVNSALHQLEQLEGFRDDIFAAVDPHGRLGELLSRLAEIPDELAGPLASCVKPVVEPDPASKSAMLRPYQWFLNQVGDAGISLTQAGYLPPAQVEALADVLQLDDIWMGKNNREVQTYPVLQFRESARQLGLIRKAHNRLSLTKAGSRARTDTELLWRVIANALPVTVTTRGPEVRASQDAGLLLLVGVGGGLSRADRSTFIALGLDLLGWRAGPFTPLSERDVHQLVDPTETVLEYAGVMPRESYRTRADDNGAPAAAGVAFARLAVNS